LITSKEKDLIIYMAYTDRRLIACQSCFILCFYSWKEISNYSYRRQNFLNQLIPGSQLLMSQRMSLYWLVPISRYLV